MARRPVRRRQVRSTALTTLLLFASLAGCSTDDDRPAASSPAELTAAVQQDRLNATRRMLAIPLRNKGSTAVTIQEMQLVAPQFTVVPPAQRDDVLPPAARLDFPLSYGRPRCGAKPAGEPAVQIRLRGADGRRQDLRLKLAPPTDVLDRLRATECGQVALLSAVGVDYGPTVHLPGRPPAMAGSLVLRRRASTQPVTVVEIRGSVLFDLIPSVGRRESVATMPATAALVTIPVRMTVPRCDPHVLIEAKKIYSFSVGLRIGTGPVQFLQIPPPIIVENELRALIGACSSDR